jgi:membrane-bound lytic murein transglycosylase MltF
MRLLLLLVLFAWTLNAAAHSVPFTVPKAARPFKELLRREAQKVFENAPIALFASLIEAESSWRPRARSPSGDLGLAQIKGTTARYLARVRPGPGPGSASDPVWSIKAMLFYVWHLKEAIKGAANETEHLAMALSSYNGGLGTLLKERKLCARTKGCDPSKWFGNVEKMKRRSTRAFRENRNHVRKVFARARIYQSWERPPQK